jgi:hypothetical protein
MTYRARETKQPALPRRRGALAALVVVLALATAGAAAGQAGAAPGDVVWKDFSQRIAGGADSYAALAVSAAGDACVAGSTADTPGGPGDVLVRTYGPGGKIIWSRVWTWPGRSDDGAAALARDRRGSIVVAGSSGSAWLLLKYSAGGYLQWVRRGHGEFARCSFAAVTVDGAGNVYAAGAAAPAGGASRLLLRKYTAAGAFRWPRTLASTGGDAQAAAIVLGGGDVYVAGRSATGEATSAALVARYSASGMRRWTRAYAGAGAEAVRATGIAYAAGPVIAGWGAAEAGSPQGFVARYGTDGTPAWATAYSAEDVTGSRFDGLVADAAGVCATGSRWTGGGQEMLTVRYDALGALAWECIQTGATRGTAVCRTAGGFCNVGGTDAASAGLVSAAGTSAWEQAVAPAGYTGFLPAAVAAGGADYLYAAGAAAHDGGSAAMLIRYRPSPGPARPPASATIRA